MLAKIYSMATIGLESYVVEVEVDMFNGLPKFIIVGLGDTAIQESRQRVRSALKNSEYQFPMRIVVASLAPADIKKTGPGFDLPIAIGILIASNQIQSTSMIDNSIFIGELALNGDLRHVNGILPIVSKAVELGYKNIFVPTINSKEAALIAGINVHGINNLSELIEFIQGTRTIPQAQRTDFADYIDQEIITTDFQNIRGQEQAKRALEIAAAGSHNILFNGAPGAGKTLMAKALRSILPKLTTDEALEVTKIFSIANMLPADKPLVTKRPFRAVHHTASAISIVGGGKIPKPGEITLAHRGVLFLDELAEFPGDILEVLRQPLEDREITITRAQGRHTFPAHFTLIAAMNPCPCGYFNVPFSDKECVCSANQISRYLRKISGPLLDRFDLHIDIAPVKYEKLTENIKSPSSVLIQKKVQNARDIQTKRFYNSDITTNAEMSIGQVEQFCILNLESSILLKNAMNRYALSARGYHRILKVARTIADLANENNIAFSHIAEALQFRVKKQPS